MDKFAEIKKLHIFSAGTPVTSEYTEEYLDKLIGNFKELSESESARLKPVLKLTHDEDQESIWKKIGVLGSGFVKDIYREGKKLFADIANVPEVIAEALTNGDINNQPSVEIYRDFEDSEGNKFGPALRAVSLLIDDIPKVKGLEGFASIYQEEIAPEYEGLLAFKEASNVETFAVPLKKEIESEERVEEVTEDMWKVAGWRVEDKMREILKEDIPAEEKKAQLQTLIKDATSLITEKIQEVIDSFAEKQPAITDEMMEKYLAKKAGMTLAEFREKQKEIQKFNEEKQAVERAQKIKTIAEGLKQKGLVGDVADKFAELRVRMDEKNKVLKFADGGEDLSIGRYADELLNLIIRKAQKNALWVEYGEVARTNPGESLEVDPDDREKMDQEVEAYREKHPDLTYAQALEEVIVNQKERANESS